MSCGPSRGCAPPQHWPGVAGQLSAEPDPHTLRVLFPHSPSKISVCLTVVLTSIPNSVMKAAELGATGSPA